MLETVETGYSGSEWGRIFVLETVELVETRCLNMTEMSPLSPLAHGFPYERLPTKTKISGGYLDLLSACEMSTGVTGDSGGKSLHALRTQRNPRRCVALPASYHIRSAERGYCEPAAKDELRTEIFVLLSRFGWSLTLET